MIIEDCTKSKCQMKKIVTKFRKDAKGLPFFAFLPPEKLNT
jgi:hypothetical protein